MYDFYKIEGLVVWTTPFLKCNLTFSFVEKKTMMMMIKWKDVKWNVSVCHILRERHDDDAICNVQFNAIAIIRVYPLWLFEWMMRREEWVKRDKASLFLKESFCKKG